MSISVNIPPGNNNVPSLTFTTYIPAPPVLPPPAIPRPKVICSDSFTQSLRERYKSVPKTVRVRFVYTPAQANAVARLKLSLTNGLKDSRSITVSFRKQISMGQRVRLDDDSGRRYLGAVYGIEINQTGKIVTKTIMLRRIYE